MDSPVNGRERQPYTTGGDDFSQVTDYSDAVRNTTTVQRAMKQDWEGIQRKKGNIHHG
jgi:hypothetical protein